MSRDIFVQSETIRGEGRWYWVEPLTQRGREMLKAYPGEGAFLGSRAKKRAEAALRAVLRHAADPFSVACSCCGAAIGEPCWNRRHRLNPEPNGYPHKERITASVEVLEAANA